MRLIMISSQGRSGANLGTYLLDVNLMTKEDALGFGPGTRWFRGSRRTAELYVDTMLG